MLFGLIGALVGTFAGYRVRMYVAKLFGRDLPAALLESACALAIAVFAVSRIHHDILVFGDHALLLLPRLSGSFL